ncbi:MULTISPECIES: 4-hydroxy-tetrahydrodipicolinate reductase [Hyphobacterium]|uniref:4-hydroxy-tetrahydrodipicolinate reductase n=1 Tax=Hyphobacterium vulgare TaxID=1736751 RepID=A0ABV6ZX94_9PROT
MAVNIAILGVSGRMGHAIVGEIALDRRCNLHGGIVRSDSEFAGTDIGVFAGTGFSGVSAVVRLEEGAKGAHVVIDVSVPDATVAAAERLAAMGGIAMVTGVTGLDAEQLERLKAASERMPILAARNFSLGVAILEDLVRQAAAALPLHRWDAEIVETHHRAKTDAPSGTALMMGEAIAEARSQAFDQVAMMGRSGQTGYRPPGTIGVASVRGGAVIGEHDVKFLSDYETITLSHVAHDRRVFARGAIDAARWLAGKPPGLYSMRDIVSG